jgi:hypothetical protein
LTANLAHEYATLKFAGFNPIAYFEIDCAKFDAPWLTVAVIAVGEMYFALKQSLSKTEKL